MVGSQKGSHEEPNETNDPGGILPTGRRDSMREADRAELTRLREQQARLEGELKLLAQQLNSFEERVISSEPPKVRISAEAPAQCVSSPPPIAVPLQSPPGVATHPPSIASFSAQVFPGQQADSGEAPPILSTIRRSPLTAQVSVPGADKIPKESQRISRPSLPQQSSPAVAPPLNSGNQKKSGFRSFEMRLGTFWLVRIGVVMVLTGLVFFGNLAYHNYISNLGPGGKVSLLYLASGLLLTAGWWWQRKAARETLRNYAQVLFAGGLGALYFTTYAAHHLEPLQVIRSALLDGLLLLSCAGFMIWAAERKKSEVLALFALGLAYYTSIITRVGQFTLWSNLVLSSASVFFLVRNRWAALSLGSLAATYVAYGFWRFFDGSNWHWASPEEGLWSGACFLALYWLVFTSAVFLLRNEKFAGEHRASFLTINNGAFFTLFLLTMIQVRQGGFWKFAFIYGVVLLGLAGLAKRALRDEPLALNTYLTQGLLLITVGFISKFAGLHLAIILAAESVLLLVLGQQRKNLVLVTGAYITGALAVGWGMDGLKQFDATGMRLAGGLGALMMTNALLMHRYYAAHPSRDGQAPVVLRPQTSYFVLLSLAIWVAVSWDNSSRDVFPIVVGAEALLLSFSVYALRIPEVTLFSQALLILAQVVWFFNRLDHAPALPWWNPASLIGINLILSHWWSKQTIIQPKASNGLIWPGVYSLGVCFIIYLWLVPGETTPSWLLTTSILALSLTAYGVMTRAWFIAACAQLFSVVSVIQFGFQLWEAKPAWPYPLAPMLTLGLLSFGTVQWFIRRPEAAPELSRPLLQIALVYRWIALVLSVIWICDYVPARERIWILAFIGLLAFFWAGLWRNREALLFSATYTAIATVHLWLPLFGAPTVYIPNLLVILTLLAEQQVAQRRPHHYPLESSIHNIVILIGGLSLWLFVSRWVMEMANGFYLTASWSVLALALFAVGLVLRARMYRWVGLGVLSAALGKVIIFDVWRLETVYRILSFMALGIVLLVLGFIYSKYQEKIKEWL
jgi:uncharacterized membrane protein